jgi:hypothetical protein
MFDDMFPFMDLIIENNVDTFLILLDGFFGFIEENGIDRAISLSEETKTGIPLHIALSKIKPDELEKLKRYVVAYFAKQDGSEA